MKTVTILAAALAAAIAPGAASAATYTYTLSYPVGSDTLSWQLPDMPAPDLAVDGEGFALERVTLSRNAASPFDAYLDFFSAANGGGMSFSDADSATLFASVTGAQLYSGSETAPVMRRGVFAMTDNLGQAGYTLTVANQLGGVPEPTTWALMILGFGAVGGAMRVRRTSLRYA